MADLSAILKKFDETMGGGVIHSASVLPPCTKILSSVPAYNYITHGGFQVGRIMEHYGENSCLKSYLLYDALARFQRFDWANHVPNVFSSFEYNNDLIKTIKSAKTFRGYKPVKTPVARKIALIDAEATYTPEWGAKFGIDNDGLILVRPSHASQCVDVVQALLSDPMIALVGIDSLSALGTDEELDKSMEDNQMASGAKFWNKAVKKFQSAMNGNTTKESTLMVINSEYQAVGMVFGDPNRVRNGSQLKLAKSLSVKFRGGKEIEGKTDHGDIVVGKNVFIECKKNKQGTGGRSSNFFYAYSNHEGTEAGKTDVVGQLVDLAQKLGVVERKGAWFQWGEVRVQGMEAFKQKVLTEGLVSELEKQIRYD